MQNGPEDAQPKAPPPAQPSRPAGLAGAQYRYLPWLSLLLCVLTGVWLVKYYLFRPPKEHRDRVTSFDLALEFIPDYYDGEVDEDKLYEAAMKAMIDSLDDPHSFYMNRYQVTHTDTQIEGEFGGVGVVIGPGDGVAIVTEVMADGPGAKAGLKAGDLIVAVDGKEVAEMSFIELVSRVRGKIGTEVQLTIKRADAGERETVKVTRDKITLETVTWEMLDGGVGYVQVRSQFDAHTEENIREALEELVKDDALKAVLLDLRGNTGGLLEQAVGIVDMFLAEGVIVSIESRNKEERASFDAKAETVIPVDLPMAILVDSRSASASEVVAGALQAQKRATLVGANTFGKGAVNRVFGLPDGSGVLLTVAHYTVGDGQEIEGKGLEPDVKVGKMPPLPDGNDTKARQEWLAAYNAAQKEQFDRAVELLKGKLSP